MLEIFVFSTRAFNSAVNQTNKCTFLLFCIVYLALNDSLFYVYRTVFINKKNERLKLKYILYL